MPVSDTDAVGPWDHNQHLLTHCLKPSPDVYIFVKNGGKLKLKIFLRFCST